MSTILGTTTRRAVVSPNGQWLAALVEDKEIQILRMGLSSPEGRLHRRIRISDRGFASKVNTIRWSPEPISPSNQTFDDGETSFEASQEVSSSRVLLSDGRHIQVYGVEETGRGQSPLLHLDMGDTFGKISFVDFIFDHQHALIMTETNVQATILTIDTRSYLELKTPKFPSLSSFAHHPRRKHVSVLTRTDGKDVITTYKMGESTWASEAVIYPSTADAQGFTWSPDGIFLAVWDTASMGCKVKFHTADGQELEHMDILKLGVGGDLSDFEGLGVKSISWLSSSDILAISDYAGNIILRRLDASNGWAIVDVLSHRDQIEDPSTFVWQESLEAEQLVSQTLRPFPLPTVAALTPGGIPRSVDVMTPNCDGTMLASTSGFLPSTVYIWQGFRSPLAVITVRDPVKQVLWHPHIPDALLILTAAVQPRIHLWTKNGEPKSVNTSLRSEAVSGKVEIKWIQNPNQDDMDIQERSQVRKPEDYLFMICNEKAFDLGFLLPIDDENKSTFHSILNSRLPS